MGCVLRLPHIKSYLKTAHKKARGLTPIFIHATIQLAGFFLANNHTIKLLSDLLGQVLYLRNISLETTAVNSKTPPVP